MAVIYIPINPTDKQRLEEQKVFLAKLVNDGWIYLGNVSLTDVIGTEITVAVLREGKEKEEEKEEKGETDKEKEGEYICQK